MSKLRITAALLLCLALVGCGTLKGMGHDLKRGGHIIRSPFTGKKGD